MKKIMISVAILAIAVILVAETQAGLFGRLFRRRRVRWQQAPVVQCVEYVEPVVETEPEPEPEPFLPWQTTVDYHMGENAIYMLL